MDDDGEKTKKAAKFQPPAWVDRDAWAGYLEMRRAIRKPATVRAMQLSIKTLEKLRDAGNDPNEVLDQSTQRCWQGLFQLPPEMRTKPESNPALQAWNEVRQACRNDYTPPPRGWSDNKTANALEAIGGFIRMQNMRTDEIGFMQREFEAQYRIAKPRPPSRVVPININQSSRRVVNG